MHEMSTCKHIIHLVETQLETYPGKNVSKICLSIGALARVDVDELMELFPLAAKGTCTENANLVIEHEPISVYCDDCELTSSVPTDNLNCPQCKSSNTRLVSGTDMLLKELEFV